MWEEEHSSRSSSGMTVLCFKEEMAGKCLGLRPPCLSRYHQVPGPDRSQSRVLMAPSRSRNSWKLFPGWCLVGVGQPVGGERLNKQSDGKGPIADGD